MKRSKASLLALAATGAGVYLAARAIGRGNRSYDLRGKIALIAGGSRGLGLVLGREFVRQGVRVAICARDAEELERASADLVRQGMPVVAVPCDVTKYDQVQEMVHTVRQHQVGPPETMTLEDFEEAMRVNFGGVLHTMLAVIPEMRERREGRIVNISSIGGKIAVPHLVPYTASKFAVTGLSKAMRAELIKDGVV